MPATLASPAAILRSNQFDETASVTLARCTTDPTEAPLFRLHLQPSEENGLHSACHVMIDKVTTVPKATLGQRIGRLSDDDLVRLNRAVAIFLGLA